MLKQRRFSKTGMRVGHVFRRPVQQWMTSADMHNLDAPNGYNSFAESLYWSEYLGPKLWEQRYDNTSSSQSFIGGLNDLVLDVLFHESTFPSRPHEWYEWHNNAARDPKGHSIDNFTRKPRQSALSLAEDVSVKSISQTVDIVKRLLSNWDFSPYQGDVPAFESLKQYEKPCSHLTYNGDVTLGEFTFFPNLGDELALWDGPAYTMFTWEYYTDGLHLNIHPGANIPWDFKGNRKHPLVQLEWLKRDKVSHHTSGPAYLVTGEVSHWLQELEWNLHDDGSFSSIDWQTCSILNPWNEPVQHRFTFDCVAMFGEFNEQLNFREETPLLVESHSALVAYIRTRVEEHKRTLVNPGEWGPWQPSRDFIDHGSATTVVPFCSGEACFWSIEDPGDEILGFSPLTSVSNVTGVHSPWTPDYMLVDYEIRLTEFIGQTRGLLSVAAAEAVNKMQTVLSSNNIENLMQLSSILEFIEPIKALFELKKKVQNGKLTEAGLQLIDILANAELLYSYGIAPTISDAKEVARLAKPLRAQFKSREFNEMKTVYGEARYTGHNVFGIESVDVTAHVKLCARMSDSTLAGWLMPIEALGLLPNLHRLDDNVSYTFIANWFTNQNSKFETIDAQLYAPLVMDLIGSVVSLKYEVPVLPELLEKYGLTSGTWSEAPTLSLYLRNVQAGIPSLFRTDLDLLPPPPIESKFGLSTALLWTSIRDAGRDKLRKKRRDGLY